MVRGPRSNSFRLIVRLMIWKIFCPINLLNLIKSIYPLYVILKHFGVSSYRSISR